MKFENKIYRYNNHYLKLVFLKTLNVHYIFSCWIIFTFSLTSCNKLVQVPEPVSTITSSEVFNTPANATSAISAIYSDMALTNNFGIYFGNGATTIYAGLSSDELLDYNSNDLTFQINKLLSNNITLSSQFWSRAYFDIYMANACIEGISASTTLPTTTKKQLLGEAKFLRAFIYFYLINLFGDVPLVTTSSFETSSLLPRTSTEKIYQHILIDLNDAKNSLAIDYSTSGGPRTRANAFAAIAFMARIYLYQQKWDSAEIQATLVINNSGMYNLTEDLNEAFLKNSNESILQLENINKVQFAIQEARRLIPLNRTSAPTYNLTSQLLDAFEPGDKRRTNWVDSTYVGGTYYYYPYKYKVKRGTADNITEYYTLLRLAEQYLIRAEARIHQNNLNGGISDLNIIRKRSGLPDLATSLSQQQLLDAVAHERRIELFAEWGHRWLDLKRTGQATTILGSMKSEWDVTAQLWPIPSSELQLDPNLIQNPGYQN